MVRTEGPNRRRAGAIPPATVPVFRALAGAVLLAVALAGLLPSSSAADDSIPTFDEFFRPEHPSRSPSKLAWSPDAKMLVYVFEEDAGKALWTLPATGGEPRVLLRLGEEATLEKLDEVRWSPDSRHLVLVSDGDLYLLALDGSRLTRLTETEGEEEDPKFSPDSSRLAYVRDANLYVRSLVEETKTAQPAERALTTDGDDVEILNGKTDWVYWEELWNRDSTGFWWSLDGSKIAYYRFEEQSVASYPLLNALPVYPEVQWQKYPKAGTTNPVVKVGVIAADGGETHWLPIGPTGGDGSSEEWYPARVHWTHDGAVAVERLSRDQDVLELIRCQTSGTATCTLLVRETSPTWVNVEYETTFLKDGSFLWGSDRSGWREIYLYDPTGELVRQVTRGEGHVTDLDAVLEDEGEIVYTRYQPGFLGAKDREVRRSSLDGTKDRGLSSGPGWHRATVASDGTWVHRWDDADHLGFRVIESADGKEIARLPKTRASGADPESLPRWKFFTLPGPGGVELPARLLEPAGFDPARRYPALMYHYGGPESQVVENHLDGGQRALWFKWMAQRGYFVLMVDNELSNFFGKKGSDKVHRRFGPNNLAAQLAGVEYLKGLGNVDPDRIGLWGWSGGGHATLYCLLNRPGVWKAGVAGAPVTDWRFYDSIWTERYLDHPSTNEEGYRLSSAVTYAKDLKDKVLIVHGTGDDNVHPQNTFALIKLWIDAGLPFEDAIYPRQKHGFKDGEYAHFLARMTEFFDRHLRPCGAE
ncbi:MAG: DPP IV N-terminal domain-containing protein [Acidobacteria bacterium]|nr:DPP IV N-terminal domain-containing protein [Acidobacteriota bacterium]